MTISLIFSLSIYQVAASEMNTRLNQIETKLHLPRMYEFEIIRSDQLKEAKLNIIVGLAYINLVIFIVGGSGSYYLARRAIKPIEEAHEAQSRFTSDASHELRTPLATMKTEIEVALRDKNLTNSEMKELLISNLEEVNKLANLSHTLLKLAKLESSSVDLVCIDIVAGVGSVVKKLDNIEKRIVSKYDKNKTINVMLTDGSIEELTRILLDNAIKYSPSNSQIIVSINTKGDKAILKIQNEGPGINKDQLPHIFDRFYRVDNARTNASENGYGLGLSVAKKLVELNNAEIVVNSHVGKTTTFSIIFKHNRNSQV